MLTTIQKRIIARAINIRLSQGEELEEILATYTKLTEDEKQEFLAMYANNN